MALFNLSPGTTPLLVSMPHCGTHVPDEIAQRFTPTAHLLGDTDWHMERLYDFAADLGAGVLAATHSRYVIDLNRPPDDKPLYPSAAGTGLCPATTFDGEPLYQTGADVDDAEKAERLETYWRPYHDRLAADLARIKAAHGIALLYEAHSIRSEVPRLFDGRLPDLNLGSADGAALDAGLAGRLEIVCAAADGFTWVHNGRFKGGYTTRAYGDPANGVHAVQMEQAQITYMIEEPPFDYLPERAEKIRPSLRALLAAMLDWAVEQ